MRKIISVLMITLVLLVSAPAMPAHAQEPDWPGCDLYAQDSGALHVVCLPPGNTWNGGLVIFAHGYVPEIGQGPMIPIEQLILQDGTFVPDLVKGLGFAFATSSYPVNGLAVKPAVPDMAALVNTFTTHYTNPLLTYLVGASEGGLVTTLAVEKYPNLFQGGLDMCGPIGDFRKQINYWGDFRLAWNYFFPNVVPGSVEGVDISVMAGWDGYYKDLARGAAEANSSATDKLLSVAMAPYDHKVTTTKLDTIEDILWYNVFATNDGIAKLGGNPYYNASRHYNNAAFNAAVNRYWPDPTAQAEIAKYYQTSGKLRRPLVSLHTTGDPIVPYWHTTLYRAKTLLNRSTLNFINIPIARYGHCAFNTSELLFAFSVLNYRATGIWMANARGLAPGVEQQHEFDRMIQKYKLSKQ